MNRLFISLLTIFFLTACVEEVTVTSGTSNIVAFEKDGSTITSISIEENTSIDNVKVVINGTPVEASNLIFSITSDNQILLPDEYINLSGTGKFRTLTISPSADQSGETELTATITDTSTGEMITGKLTLKVLQATSDPVVITPSECSTSGGWGMGSSGNLVSGLATNEVFHLTEYYPGSIVIGILDNVKITAGSAVPENANVQFIINMRDGSTYYSNWFQRDGSSYCFELSNVLTAEQRRNVEIDIRFDLAGGEIRGMSYNTDDGSQEIIDSSTGLPQIQQGECRRAYEPAGESNVGWGSSGIAATPAAYESYNFTSSTYTGTLNHLQLRTDKTSPADAKAQFTVTLANANTFTSPWLEVSGHHYCYELSQELSVSERQGVDVTVQFDKSGVGIKGVGKVGIY